MSFGYELVRLITSAALKYRKERATSECCVVGRIRRSCINTGNVDVTRKHKKVQVDRILVVYFCANSVCIPITIFHDNCFEQHKCVSFQVSDCEHLHSSCFQIATTGFIVVYGYYQPLET